MGFTKRNEQLRKSEPGFSEPGVNESTLQGLRSVLGRVLSVYKAMSSVPSSVVRGISSPVSWLYGSPCGEAEISSHVLWLSRSPFPCSGFLI